MEEKPTKKQIFFSMEGRDLTMLDVDLAMLNVVFVKFNLVGGFNPSEKYESVGIIIFPTDWKVIKIMFQSPPTSCHSEIATAY
jgi:hypothetical protein